MTPQSAERVPDADQRRHDITKPVLVSDRTGVRQDGSPRTNSAGRSEKLEALLSFEAELRRAQTVRELVYCLANETLKIIDAQQVFVLKPGKFRNNLKIDAVTNLSSVDRNAPALVALERLFSAAFEKASRRPEEQVFAPYAFSFGEENSFPDAKFNHLEGVLLPMFDKAGRLFSAMVIVGHGVAQEKNFSVYGRIAEASRHAWLALKPRPVRLFSASARKVVVASALLASFLALFLPVPLSTLAPVEIVAKEPQIVAAPIDGVIDQILVEPNARVLAGEPLFRFVDTTLKSDLSVAEQRRAVAQAKLQTARQNSFGSGDGRRDIAVAEAELNLTKAEYEFAKAQFSKTLVRASSSGIAIFDRKTDWQGRPVAVGERIIEIADGSKVEAHISLAVSDAIVLDKDARVKLFLDLNPLTPLNANVTIAGYRASASEGDSVAYPVFADLAQEAAFRPRIGARGTAQIFGEDVSLAFYLFRRPLSVIRQWMGW